MKKFVYHFEYGVDLFIKATDIKEATKQIKKVYGQKPNYIAETNYRSIRKTTEQFTFELNLLK